jgi:hypothetical protein
MAWERRGESLFFYQSRRTPDGKVIKEFVGRGDRAASAAAAVENATARRQADAQAIQEEQARLAGPDAVTEELVAVADLLMEATLLATGFHRWNYGRWRKKRDQEERNRAAAGPRSPR